METYALHFRGRFYSNCCWVENLFNKVAQILTRVRLKKAQLQIPIHVNSTGIAFSSLRCLLRVCKPGCTAPHPAHTMFNGMLAFWTTSFNYWWELLPSKIAIGLIRGFSGGLLLYAAVVEVSCWELLFPTVSFSLVCPGAGAECGLLQMAVEVVALPQTRHWNWIRKDVIVAQKKHQYFSKLELVWWAFPRWHLIHINNNESKVCSPVTP